MALMSRWLGIIFFLFYSEANAVDVAEVKPFVLGLKRVYEDERCTIGELYLNGELISHTLERPWRNNKSYISSIPEGSYDAFIRFKEGKKDWWRIQLKGTSPREGIQFHIGNVPESTQGCVLVGKSASITQCALRGSVDSLNKIRSLFYEVNENITPHPELIDSKISGKPLVVKIDYTYAPTSFEFSDGSVKITREGTEWNMMLTKGGNSAGRFSEIARNSHYILLKGTSGYYKNKYLRMELNGGKIEWSSDKNKWHIIEFGALRNN